MKLRLIDLIGDEGMFMKKRGFLKIKPPKRSRLHKRLKTGLHS
jgi:hypothetical protein